MHGPLNVKFKYNCSKHSSRNCILKDSVRISQVMKLFRTVCNTRVRNPPGAGIVSLGTTNISIFEHNDSHSPHDAVGSFPSDKSIGFYDFSVHLHSPQAPKFTNALSTCFYGVICRQGWGGGG